MFSVQWDVLDLWSYLSLNDQPVDQLKINFEME